MQIRSASTYAFTLVFNISLHYGTCYRSCIYNDSPSSSSQLVHVLQSQVGNPEQSHLHAKGSFGIDFP